MASAASLIAAIFVLTHCCLLPLIYLLIILELTVIAHFPDRTKSSINNGDGVPSSSLQWLWDCCKLICLALILLKSHSLKFSLQQPRY